MSGDWPDLIVEAGFSPGVTGVDAANLVLNDAVLGLLGTGTLGGGVAWTDITAFVQDVQIARPGNRQQGPVVSYEAATVTLTLNNSDARFTPDNLAGPYVIGGVTQVRPMVPLRIRCVWGNVVYPLFRGFVSSWIPPTDDYGLTYAITGVSAADAFRVLEGIQLPTTGAVGAGELTGARVSRILNAAGWYDPAWQLRDIGAGKSTLQATTYGDSALALLQDVALAEIGDLYVDGAGVVTFRDRYAPMNDTRSSTVQAVFGDRPGTSHTTSAAGGILTNWLATPTADFEGSNGTWTGAGNATLANTAAQAHSGANSMQMTSGASGDMTAASCLAGNISTQGMPCTAGDQVTVSAWFRAAASARDCQVGVTFYDSGGTSLSSVYSTGVTNTTTGWTQVTNVVAAVASAAYCRLAARVQATGAASEVHYVDDASLARYLMTELQYSAVTIPCDDTTLANDVQATRDGGVLQHVTDTASVTRYLFPRTFEASGLQLQADADALQWANYVLYIAKADEVRFDELTVQPAVDPGNLWPQVLGRELGDRIQVWRRPPGMAAPVTRDCFIRGITHTYTVREWETVWTLQAATRYSFMTLNNTTLGQLDENALAF